MEFDVSVFIRDENQLKVIFNYPVDMIYTDNLDLVKKYPTLYYQVPRVYETLSFLPKNLLINDVGLLEQDAKEKNIVTDYSMNVANTKTMDVLLNSGVKKIALSVEMTNPELKFMKDIKNYPAELLVYGRVEVMLLKKHPIFHQNGFCIVNEQKQSYPVFIDEDKHVHIYHFEAINRLKDFSFYLECGIKHFRIDFLDEDENQINAVLQKVFAHSLSISC